MNTYCYWSVADGRHAVMLNAAVNSARTNGVYHDFHIWSDIPVKGAENHRVHAFDKSHYLFKFHYLEKHVSQLNYDYFIWLDADTYFVRNPGNPLSPLRGAPVHACLESDACSSLRYRDDWWGCPMDRYAQYMYQLGVRSNSIFNVNAGFWIVHKLAIERFCELCREFWQFTHGHGHTFTEEAPLAYATHMLVGDPYEHTIRRDPDLWASDWRGRFDGVVPDGRPWFFEDYFTGEKIPVNPAIVHAMRSKDALVEQGEVIRKGPR